MNAIDFSKNVSFIVFVVLPLIYKNTSDISLCYLGNVSILAKVTKFHMGKFSHISKNLLLITKVIFLNNVDI